MWRIGRLVLATAAASAVLSVPAIVSADHGARCTVDAAVPATPAAYDFLLLFGVERPASELHPGAVELKLDRDATLRFTTSIETVPLGPGRAFTIWPAVGSNKYAFTLVDQDVSTITVSYRGLGCSSSRRFALGLPDTAREAAGRIEDLGGAPPWLAAITGLFGAIAWRRRTRAGVRLAKLTTDL